MWILRQNFTAPVRGYLIGFDPFSAAQPAVATQQPSPAQMPMQGQMSQQQQQMPQSVPSAAVPGRPSGVVSNVQDNLNGFGSTQPATGGESPLEKYSSLFDNGQSKQGQQQQQQQQQTQQQQDQSIQEALDLMKYGPADYQAAASKLSFTSGIDSSMFQAALGGDAEALMKILDSVGRNVFAAASHSSSKLAGTALKQNLEQYDRGLSDKFKNFSLNQSQQNIVNNSAPILNNPAVQPMLKQAMALMAKSYPEASSEEITNHAIAYLRDVSSVINGTQQNAQQMQQQQLQDNKGYGDLFGM